MAFKDWLAKIFKIRRKVTVIPTNEQQLNRAVDKERGRLMGEVIRQRKKNQELTKKIQVSEDEKKRESIERLNEKKEQLSNESLYGGCDWRALFSMLNKKPKKFKIRVVSFNLKKDFGLFDSLITDSKGMINLFVKDGKERKRIITGSKFSHIFRFPYGISKMAKKGMFIINLNENGEYVSDPLHTEIPDLVVDKDGKFDLSQVDTEPFIDRYIKIQGELADAHLHIETLEKTISEKIRQENLTKHQLNVTKARAETAESELTTNINAIKEMHKSYSDVVARTSTLSQQLDIITQQNSAYSTIIEEIIAKLEESKTRTKLEDTKDLIEDTMEMIDRFRPQSQEVIVKPETPSKMEQLKEKGKNI